ncbi:unnamed protein product, partial [Mesorhabditis belari]|uniref:Uncharacterized protein n=1 Tax=Mesorhabditis belari TaxID=2138241 RepID=A0AAF3FPA5_9BILA
MKKNSIDIFLSTAKESEKMFFMWYSCVFDLVHGLRPNIEEPDPETEGQVTEGQDNKKKSPEWDMDNDEYYRQFANRKDELYRTRSRRDSADEFGSELTEVREQSDVEDETETVKARSTCTEESYDSDVTEEDDEDEAEAEADLVCFRIRGLPGLLQLASIATTRSEEYETDHFGIIEIYSGPERMAILRSIGMPNPFKRTAIRKLAKIYFNKNSNNFRPYTCLLIAMLYGAHTAVGEMFEEISNAYGKQTPGSIDDMTGGPIGQCHFMSEMWSRFKDLQELKERNSKDYSTGHKRWLAKYKQYSSVNAQPELYACLTFMAMVLDTAHAEEHRRTLALDMSVPFVLRIAFCAMYMKRLELLSILCTQMEVANDLNKLIFLGLGPHPQHSSVIEVGV